ncbi:hypothetical protein Pcinc_036537 [Petrolisthes cinctipes]|uniref:Uncharacterized protein n=1 Tax=Petrolisthes cinctipes TaxID=88211 RepID=A0AAE1ELV3_PETCI|nr:hypothetical protein Pcinc_036537 [Petrolisthes cinctipes]
MLHFTPPTPFIHLSTHHHHLLLLHTLPTSHVNSSYHISPTLHSTQSPPPLILSHPAYLTPQLTFPHLPHKPYLTSRFTSFLTSHQPTLHLIYLTYIHTFHLLTSPAASHLLPHTSPHLTVPPLTRPVSPAK